MFLSLFNKKILFLFAKKLIILPAYVVVLIDFSVIKVEVEPENFRSYISNTNRNRSILNDILSFYL